jgi:hypothetical protein
MSDRKKILVLLLGVAAFLLVGCAAGPNAAEYTVAVGYEAPAGFWYGLWHGIIAPITFIISLFNENVEMYEVHNNGNWYNFGFVLGSGVLFGGILGSR